jgi:hypothetical protein
MKNSYFVLSIILNMLLSIFFIATSDTKISASYAQQLQTDVTETPATAATCEKSIQKNPILCYIFMDYFCTEKCHAQQHKINQYM